MTTARAKPTPRITKSIRLKLWDKISRARNGCWNWTGNKRLGYGIVHIDGRRYPAHRVMYAAYVAPIDPCMVVDHLCRNPACVNPCHIEVVTQQENTLRGNGPSAANARKTHCQMGHPLRDDNLRYDNGGRVCRTCAAAANRKWRRGRVLTPEQRSAKRTRDHHYRVRLRAKRRTALEQP